MCHAIFFDIFGDVLDLLKEFTLDIDSRKYKKKNTPDNARRLHEQRVYSPKEIFKKLIDT